MMSSSIPEGQISQTQTGASPRPVANCELTAEIRLDRARAARWLVCAESILSHSGGNNAFSQFCDRISEACWLARWKRDYVLLPVDTLAVPQILSDLIGAELFGDDSQAAVMEDMLATLGRSQLTGSQHN